MSEKMKGKLCPKECKDLKQYATSEFSYCDKFKPICLKEDFNIVKGWKIYRCPECLKKEKSR
jgi:hypothetical protein